MVKKKEESTTEEELTEEPKKKGKIKLDNPTGIAEIDAILSGLTKEFNTDMSGENYGDIVCASTGSLVVDAWTRRGGIPTGRIIEVFGASRSMKTTFAILALAERQKWRKLNNIVKRDLFIDLECSTEEGLFKAYGVDLDQVIWQRPDNIEQALESCRRLGRTGVIDYVIFDSVDAGQNEKQQRRSVGEVDVGGITKEMNFALRDLSKIAPKHGVTYFFINQIRDNPMAGMYQSSKVVPGGSALRFYSTFSIEMMPREKCTDIPNATVCRLKGVKTKIASDVDWDMCHVAILPGKGYDPIYELNSLGNELELLRHSGGQTKVRWTSSHDWEPIDPLIEKGKEAGLAFITSQPRVQERLKHSILRALEISTARPDSDFAWEGSLLEPPAA